MKPSKVGEKPSLKVVKLQNGGNKCSFSRHREAFTLAAQLLGFRLYYKGKVWNRRDRQDEKMNLNWPRCHSVFWERWSRQVVFLQNFTNLIKLWLAQKLAIRSRLNFFILILLEEFSDEVSIDVMNFSLFGLLTKHAQPYLVQGQNNC